MYKVISIITKYRDFMIKIYDSHISEKVCDDLINVYNRNGLEKMSDVTLKVVGQLTKPFNDPDWLNLLEILKSDTLPLIEDYLSSHSNLLSKDMYSFSHAGFTLKKEGDCVPYHFDAEVTSVGGIFKVSHFAVIIYLNSDYEGGDLVFPHQRKTIIPKKGTVAIFPTSYLYPHLITPVIKGSRYDIRLTYYNNRIDLKNFTQ